MLGGGLLTKGNLQDEDFPPGISPYSSTNSTLQNQTLGYLSTDIGGAILRGRDFRLDGFVGYHYMHMRLKAFGCTQTATNTSVCSPSIPDSVGVIVQDNNWHSLRVGLAADIPVVRQVAPRCRGRLSALCLAHRHRQPSAADRPQRSDPGGRPRLGLSARGDPVLPDHRCLQHRRRRPLLAHADQRQRRLLRPPAAPPSRSTSRSTSTASTCRAATASTASDGRGTALRPWPLPGRKAEAVQVEP